MRIAGYELYAGGPDALVGGVRVSVVDDGLVHDGTTANYAEVTGLVTSAVISTTTDEAGSTEVVSSSSTVAVAESTGSASATESESESGTSASESANGTAESATGGAAVGATAKSKSAVSALVGIAGLLCVLA